jgi:pyruvate/2-oxoglutarate dehydrogenase complex dihydrolipoamide dehydrogenase (E3) component
VTCSGEPLWFYDERPFDFDDVVAFGRIKRRDVDPDLIIVGGGAAGLGAARTARAQGASVVLVEQAQVGGDCTFTGCVPSKAIIEAAGRGEGFDTAMKHARRAIDEVAATESAEVLRHEGIDVIEGTARFVGPRTLSVEGARVHGGAVVIATGARPTVPPIAGLDTVEYLTNETLFELTTLPESIAVMGGGPIGVEMAQAFARLGAAVTLVEAGDRVLSKEEPLASAVVAKALREAGVTLRMGQAVGEVEARTPAAGVRLHLADGSLVEAAALLVAVGRTPTTDGLGLESIGVGLDERGFVRVDDRLRTSAKGVFASGDVAEPLQFTHVAYETGRIAARNALARLPLRRFHPGRVPWVTFTDPEVARIGLSESDAARSGGRVAFLPMAEVDRAVSAGRTEGYIKIVAGPRPVVGRAAGGRLLGATVVAPRAGEMVHELVLAMAAGMFPARLALTTHAYPTWSMAVQQAAAQFFGEFGGRRARPASAHPGDSAGEWAALGLDPS